MYDAVLWCTRFHPKDPKADENFDCTTCIHALHLKSTHNVQNFYLTLYSNPKTINSTAPGTCLSENSVCIFEKRFTERLRSMVK